MFLPLFFVNYWKFFRGIFARFFPFFRSETLPGSRFSERKFTRFRVFQELIFAFFLSFPVKKSDPGKAIFLNNVLDKGALCRYNISVVI